MQKTFFLIIVLLSLFLTPVLGEVEPPNYNFSLDTFKNFGPGKTLKEIQTKFGDGELMLSKGTSQIYKFYVTHIRYKFAVMVTFFEEKSVSFHARLPSYFLHDVFHQSLINRYGKQDHYSKKENAAVYVWNNEKGVKYTYQGTCTITCFPVYYQGSLTEKPPGFSGSLNILDDLNEKNF